MKKLCIISIALHFFDDLETVMFLEHIPGAWWKAFYVGVHEEAIVGLSGCYFPYLPLGG